MARDKDKLPSDPSKQASGRSEIDAFLRKAAATPATVEPGKRGRLIFALDATASRDPTWDRACHLQAEMFQETDSLGGLDIQLVYYRGFRECKASPWYSKSEPLLQHMTRVHCRGGQTQIGRIVRHAIAETKKQKVNALIFVGDCFEEDVDEVCHVAGELGVLGVPAFIFHEGGEPIAERAFRQIARLTGGAYCPFDSGSAKQLRELLSAVAVYAAGGRRALENYGRKQGGEAARLSAQLKTIPDRSG